MLHIRHSAQGGENAGFGTAEAERPRRDGGVGLALLAGNKLSPLFGILCGAFWVIWNCSTLLCLLIGLSRPSFVSLTEPE